MYPDQRPPTPVDGIRASPGLLVACLGAAVVAVAVFLPWLTGAGDAANAFEQDIPWMATGATLESPGSFAHGFLYLALAGAAGALIWWQGLQPDNASTPLMAVGGAALALSVLNFVQFTSVLNDIDESDGVSISIGVGLYLSIAGGAAVLVGALMHQQQSIAPTGGLAGAGASASLSQPAHQQMPPAAGGHAGVPPAQPAPIPQSQPSPMQQARPAQAPQPAQRPQPTPPEEQWWN